MEINMNVLSPTIGLMTGVCDDLSSFLHPCVIRVFLLFFFFASNGPLIFAAMMMQEVLDALPPKLRLGMPAAG
jgi:hypothetical protein